MSSDFKQRYSGLNKTSSVEVIEGLQTPIHPDFKTILVLVRGSPILAGAYKLDIFVFFKKKW